ncbi:MAG: hypothetical protein KGL02_10755 [Acidobacteriota bacterium]|nr:hypothetical protein [Acidobacteriota bacterium]MDE3170695.1 hypothetical protein [Acidobacteriota bacterium]
MKIRIVASLLIAAPLAVLSLAVADVGGMPSAMRYVVSPGFIFGLQAPPSGSWIGDISDALRIAIAGNELYYAILIFLVLTWLGRKKRHAESVGTAEGVVAQRR